MNDYRIIQGDCTETLRHGGVSDDLHLTFLDPPFNQNKDYAHHHDNLPDEAYWTWMTDICAQNYRHTADGGAINIMQREKNVASVLNCLSSTGWHFQNLIIWKKMTSAVPIANGYGKHYQIIAYATKGKKPRLFNKLRISPPLPANYKYERENGMFVTDVWDDIRELTSGYFAGDEALRDDDGARFHKQQAPLALLLRIILSSTQVGDMVFDPFAGTGTTLVVAHQLGRRSIGIEIDPTNVACIQNRLATIRDSDRISRFYDDYRHTDNLDAIWGANSPNMRKQDVFDLPLFRPPDSA